MFFELTNSGAMIYCIAKSQKNEKLEVDNEIKMEAENAYEKNVTITNKSSDSVK